MADTFRALCAELSGLLDNLHSLICVECPRALDEDSGGDFVLDLRIEEALERARAALADEPAVSEGREPAADLEKEFRSWWKETHGSPYFGAIPLVAVWTEYILARWGNHQGLLDSSPPADREVARLVAWLRRIGPCNDEEAANLNRAAELLQRQALVPVSVSERLPGPKDCDAEGRCWLRRKHQEDGPTWRLTRPASIGTEGLRLYYAEWLPAHALPLPLPEVGE